MDLKTSAKKEAIAFVKSLTPKEVYILCNFYGLLGFGRSSVKEISNKLGVSTTNIDNRIKRILSKLNYSDYNNLREYIKCLYM